VPKVMMRATAQPPKTVTVTRISMRVSPASLRRFRRGYDAAGRPEDVLKVSRPRHIQGELLGHMTDCATMNITLIEPVKLLLVTFTDPPGT